MLTEEIRAELFRMQDEAYRDFQGKLIPTVDPENVIGVRTPELRKYAKQLARREDIRGFLDALPHKYFDEYQLHAFIISEIKDYDVCMEEVNRFLPFVDNWATCDLPAPKCFAKHREELLPEIRSWIASGETYTIRYGIGLLMSFYLDEAFEPEYLELAAGVRSEEYYVNMMIAWYLATALAKQWEATIPYLEERRLPEWVHRKTIQKAVESYRITPEQKVYLKSLR